MKKLLIISIIMLSLTIIIQQIIVATKDKYPTYTWGKSTLIRLPNGDGININMTQEEAEELISNPKARIPWETAKEIREYFQWKNKTIPPYPKD